jgi:hypothetical protein
MLILRRADLLGLLGLNLEGVPADNVAYSSFLVLVVSVDVLCSHVNVVGCLAGPILDGGALLYLVLLLHGLVPHSLLEAAQHLGRIEACRLLLNVPAECCLLSWRSVLLLSWQGDLFFLSWRSDLLLSWQSVVLLSWRVSCSRLGSVLLLSWRSDLLLSWRRDLLLSWRSVVLLSWPSVLLLSWKRVLLLSWQSYLLLSWQSDLL